MDTLMSEDKNLIFRKIPSVDLILDSPEIHTVLTKYSRSLVLKAIHQVLNGIRDKIEKANKDDELPYLGLNNVIDHVIRKVSILSQPSLKKLINATGIIIHTNLGRSLLSNKVIKRLKDLAGSYSNLEYDINTGKRGSRYVHAEDILKELTGAEAAMVVNNNAAAVLLALDTIAKGKDAIISRGQLVEIGGSFRIPDVMKRGRVQMVEVGTTNKTTIKDYEAAINQDTALLLKVHKSNFQIVGFTEEPGLIELVALGKKHKVCVMEDLGSGCFVDFSEFGIRKEPTVQDSVSKGADIVTFSGDKMLGGPQCGIILGKKDIISEIKTNPLNRALRIDKLTLLALQETLYLYRDKEVAFNNIPTLRMICQTYQSLCLKAEKLMSLIGKLECDNFSIELSDGFSQIGGGAMPLENLTSRLLCITPGRLSASSIVKSLRLFNPPIIARLEKNRVVMDIRTIQESELQAISDSLILLSKK